MGWQLSLGVMLLLIERAIMEVLAPAPNKVLVIAGAVLFSMKCYTKFIRNAYRQLYLG
jgi:hypothetical protein